MQKKPNELTLTRVYDAPVKLVWEAWTESKHIEKWWGPRGFTLTTKSKDIRPGGKWIYTMHGPDGVDYPNITTYHEVVKYEKLVYDHGGNEERQKMFAVTVTFKENHGQTTMDMTMTLDTEKEAKAMAEFIKNANGNSTWDRLAEFLDHQATGNDPFVINRTFQSDIETVFEVWANPKHFFKWIGPTGADIKMLSGKVEEGESSFWVMATPAGPCYGQMHYKKIQRPKLLQYAQNFTDKDGNLVKPFFSATWPNQLLTTIRFTPESPKETRVTLKWDIYGDATDEERKTFREEKSGMNMGWNQSFEKIDEILVKDFRR